MHNFSNVTSSSRLNESFWEEASPSLSSTPSPSDSFSFSSLASGCRNWWSPAVWNFIDYLDCSLPRPSIDCCWALECLWLVGSLILRNMLLLYAEGESFLLLFRGPGSLIATAERPSASIAPIEKCTCSCFMASCKECLLCALRLSLATSSSYSSFCTSLFWGKSNSSSSWSESFSLLAYCLDLYALLSASCISCCDGTFISSFCCIM